MSYDKGVNNTVFLVIVTIIGASLLLILLNKNAEKIPEQLSTGTPAATQSASQPATSSASVQANTATIKTGKGNIVLTLFSDVSPKTVANFVQKARNGFYKNLSFHRVEDWVIQGGDPLGTGTGGGQMPTELNDKPFTAGSLGVARASDINVSNDAQFFITKKDSQFLNKQYANFGMVTSGMEVVEKIEVGDKILEVAIE